MSKWVLITGAAKRIGRAIALEMAKGGWNIVVHYHNSAQDAETLAHEIRAIGVEACLAQIDLAKLEIVQKLIPALCAEIGPLAALVNNASLFEADSDGDALRTAHVNAEAPRLLSQAFRHDIKPGRSGAIVNMLDADLHVPNFTAYCASKKLLAQLTVEMASAFAPAVRVNGVALGAILPSTYQSPQHFNAMVMATPLQSAIMPEEVAAMVRLLIESPSITGEIIHIDGGRHLQPKKM